jgi:hypothetical protein
MFTDFVLNIAKILVYIRLLFSSGLGQLKLSGEEIFQQTQMEKY